MLWHLQRVQLLTAAFFSVTSSLDGIRDDLSLKMIFQIGGRLSSPPSLLISGNRMFTEGYIRRGGAGATTGGGNPVWGIPLAFQVMYNTIQRWHHTEEGGSKQPNSW